MLPPLAPIQLAIATVSSSSSSSLSITTAISPSLNDNVLLIDGNAIGYCHKNRTNDNNNNNHLRNSNWVPRTRNSFCYETSHLQKQFNHKRNSWSGSVLNNSSTISNSNNATFLHRYAEIMPNKIVNADFSESSRICNTAIVDTNDNDFSSPIDLKNQFTCRLSEKSLLSIDNCDDPLYEENEDDVNSNNDYQTLCDIGLTERLIRCHPIWFLPDIQRAGAIHLLQGKEEGNFIVRQSSQVRTMALSVRLPADNGPYIEHYLIQAINGKLSLETSENSFDSIPALISHYSQCCDELPVQLSLPIQLRDVKTRQQLSSLALLGQEFWRYSNSKNSSETSGTISSPDSADVNIILNPILTTFKSSNSPQRKPIRPNTLNLNNINNTKSFINSPNCTKPKTPPIPPPRWTKPLGNVQNNFTVTTTVTFCVPSIAQSPIDQQLEKNASSQESIKRLSPEGQCRSCSTISSQNSFKGTPSKSALSSPMAISSPLSTLSYTLQSPLSVLSPVSNFCSKPLRNSSKRSRNSKKISKHYQECDILDSTNLYHCSKPDEKTSDYEDIWGPELVTFKPNFSPLISPDLIPSTQGTILSLSNNVLSPAGSQCDDSTTIKSTNSIKCALLDQKCNDDESITNALKDSFYAQPIDALDILQSNQKLIKKRLEKNSLISPQQRHSNPPFLYSDCSRDNLNNSMTISSSVDNLFLEKLKNNDVMKSSKWHLKPSDSWKIDNNWQFFYKDTNGSCIEYYNSLSENDNKSEDNVVNNNVDINEDDCVSLWIKSFPPLPVFTHHFIPENYKSNFKITTVHYLISKRFPELNLSESFIENEFEDVFSRISAYDNIRNRISLTYPSSEISDCTEFSEPWTESSQTIGIYETCGKYNRNNFNNSPNRLNSITEANDLEVCENEIGSYIRNYTFSLADDKSTTFAQNIDNFISCTKDSKETNPQIIMRNMRQFMSGMKNYLVKHGEKGFENEVERERRKLKPNEFLNLDSILESVLHRLVIRPLRDHLQSLFIEQFSINGSIKLLAQNIRLANLKTAQELGIKSELILPSNESLFAISISLQKLQLADSPLEKLDYLLEATAKIFHSVKTTTKYNNKSLSLGADDFLPILVWIIVKTDFCAAEIESEYMWGLLNQSVLTGEGGYYLTTLSSAVDVLKNIQNVVDNHLNSSLEGSSVIKVVVPNELQGSILTKTLPVKSNMTTKQICKIIAHKARITNPQDYALYRLMDDEETLLMDSECPQNYKTDKHYLLVYKRIDAKIAWPKQHCL